MKLTSQSNFQLISQEMMKRLEIQTKIMAKGLKRDSKGHLPTGEQVKGL